MIHCGEGKAGQEAIQAGPGRVVDVFIVADTEAALMGQDHIPDAAADRETGEKEAGEEPGQAFMRFAGQDEDQRKDQVELFFDTKRPGMRESAFSKDVETEILRKGKEAPERRQLAAFFKAGDSDIEQQNGEKGRED